MFGKLVIWYRLIGYGIICVHYFGFYFCFAVNIYKHIFGKKVHTQFVTCLLFILVRYKLSEKNKNMKHFCPLTFLLQSTEDY